MDQKHFYPVRPNSSLGDNLPPSHRNNKNQVLFQNKVAFNNEENKAANSAHSRIVTAQQSGTAWRPASIPAKNREVTLMKTLLLQNIMPQVGDRIKVYWPGDKQFYHGTVDDIRTQSTFHHIVYDDSDQEWMPLSERLFELEKALTPVTMSEIQRSSRTKRSLVVQGTGLYAEDRVLRKASRSSYDHKAVNGKQGKRMEATSLHWNQNKSNDLAGMRQANSDRKNNIRSTGNVNNLMAELESLIESESVPMVAVDSLIDALISIPCVTVGELRQRMKLSTKLRKIPQLEAQTKLLVNKSLDSIYLNLVDQWKTALTARNTKDIEKATANVHYMIRSKLLSATSVEKEGLKRLIHNSKVLFAKCNLDIPKSLSELASLDMP
jgi:hypothetical protein